MYEPKLGRFIQQDPIGFNAGDTNLYRFVGNSPTNATDPSGTTSTAAFVSAVSNAVNSLPRPGPHFIQFYIQSQQASFPNLGNGVLQYFGVGGPANCYAYCIGAQGPFAAPGLVAYFPGVAALSPQAMFDLAVAIANTGGSASFQLSILAPLVNYYRPEGYVLVGMGAPLGGEDLAFMIWQARETNHQLIAVYGHVAVINGRPVFIDAVHAAVSRPGGGWHSQLGPNGDMISHSTLQMLEGPQYGNVIAIFARPMGCGQLGAQSQLAN